MSWPGGRGRLDADGPLRYARALEVSRSTHPVPPTVATVAATVTVGTLIYDTTRVHGDARILLSLFGSLRVFATWVSVRLLFMLR
ncbi:hypothetical protein [Corynebacterium pygosceleis]|uniref:Uncharacterized protein n=1 Tax=Corynebacterium pygosceleis TaxID=2800406 RepID=A0A9Q4GHF7_9CORY|nr:hypothetical protein [Corynebacterium pygosceleis]MCK7636590.1 hypothetical protein [Corynebacterium pygosceleis]MCK7675164.1 hypothetical protein [Corynebacterium pygosceleis]MCX7467343.1 hypothetical protein [Corynebacterium pygosceleis]